MYKIKEVQGLMTRSRSRWLRLKTFEQDIYIIAASISNIILACF